MRRKVKLKKIWSFLGNLAPGSDLRVSVGYNPRPALVPTSLCDYCNMSLFRFHNQVQSRSITSLDKLSANNNSNVESIV